MLSNGLSFEKTISSYLHREVKELPETTARFPYYTSDGHWESSASSGADDWIAGFYPGVFWLGSLVDSSRLEPARQLTRRVETQFTANFNTGFRFQYSHLINYEITTSTESYRKSVAAARRLLNCFHPPSGLFCHQPNSQPYIAATDLYMNLPLLYWGELRDPLDLPYKETIRTALDRAAQVFIRPDNSVRHLVKIHPETGEILAREAPQGLSGGCWARGLAWLARGLIEAGIFFNSQKFTNRARQLFTYHRRNSEGLIPGFDYLLSPASKSFQSDTSAAAIIANALLLDHTYNENSASGRLAEKMLAKLFSQYNRSENDAGLLAGGCYHFPRNEGIDAATVWGDYYALEALFLREYRKAPPYLRWLTG